jgi:hypothetical protein
MPVIAANDSQHTQSPSKHRLILLKRLRPTRANLGFRAVVRHIPSHQSNTPVKSSDIL